MKLRILGALAVAAVVPFLFWTGGFDFDTRGYAALYCAFITIAVFGAACFCIEWPQEPK